MKKFAVIASAAALLATSGYAIAFGPAQNGAGVSSVILVQDKMKDDKMAKDGMMKDDKMAKDDKMKKDSMMKKDEMKK